MAEDAERLIASAHHVPVNPEFVVDPQCGQSDIVDQPDDEIGDPLLREHHPARRTVGLDVVGLVEDPTARVDVHEATVDQRGQVLAPSRDEGMCLCLQEKPDLVRDRHTDE
jgi:hypothetical protein